MHRPAARQWRFPTEILRWWPLAVVAVAAIVLNVAGVLPGWPGLVHLVALPPLDLAVDLRLLVARAPSYPLFLAGVAASVAVRSAVLGSLLALVGTTPTVGAGMARAARFYLVAVVPLALAAALEFAGLAAVYAWYAWAGLALTLLVVLVMAPRALAPRGARLRGIPDVPVYLMGLIMVGAVARLTGPWGTAVAIFGSAALTALTLVRLGRPPSARQHRSVAAATALMLLFPGTVTRLAPADPDAVLLVVPGVDTASGRGAAYRLETSALGFPCAGVFYYSYRGPDRGEVAPGEAPCPLRVHRLYAEPATQRPLGELVEAFAAQVEAIRQQTDDAPLVVVTHSQGAVIAWRAVSEGRAPGVTHLIGLGGFPHSPVAYPPPGAPGRGRIGADALRVVSWLSRFLQAGAFDPDAPLAREVLARPDGLEAVFGQPLPSGVTATLLFATADLVAAPEGHALPHGATAVIDTSHVGIVRSPAARDAIRSILEGRTLEGGSLLAAILDPALPAFLPPPVETER